MKETSTTWKRLSDSRLRKIESLEKELIKVNAWLRKEKNLVQKMCGRAGVVFEDGEIRNHRAEAAEKMVADFEKRIETAQFIQKQAEILLQQKEKVWKERVEVQALQIVKLWKELGTSENVLKLDGHKLVDPVLTEVREALALDIKDAEKMVAEFRIETLKTWALNRCPTCRKEGPAKGRLYHSGFWHQYGNSKREYQCYSTEIWEAYYHETSEIKKYQVARARSEGERESDFKREGS